MNDDHLIPGKLYKLKEKRVFYNGDSKIDSIGLKIEEIIMYIGPVKLNEKFAWFLYQGKKGIIHIGESNIHRMLIFEKLN